MKTHALLPKQDASICCESVGGNAVTEISSCRNIHAAAPMCLPEANGAVGMHTQNMHTWWMI
jgi:hypothetical protein